MSYLSSMENNNSPGIGDSIVALVGVLVIVIIAIIFFVYALPNLRGSNKSGVQVNLPSTSNVQTGGSSTNGY